MTSKLDRLLQSIDPTHTFEQLDRRADEAINAFSLGTGQISDWGQFSDCLIRFLQHLDTQLLRLQAPVPMSRDLAWGRCVQTLMHLYGRSGEKAAFEMVRTGNDGGLYAVLKAFARHAAGQYAENEVSAKVHTYWNGLSVEERLVASDEYLQKHGHLLPSELTEGSAARVRADLPKVLIEHPSMMHRLGRVGRR